MAGINFKSSSFIASGAVDDQSVTGVGFQSKWAMFYGNSRITTGSEANYNIFHGMAVSNSNQCVITAFGKDGVGGLKYRKKYNAANGYCIALIDTAIADLELAGLTTFDSDGFTVLFDFTIGTRIHFLALGGSNLSVNQGSGTIPTGTVTHTITGVGFDPDWVLFLYNGLTAGGGTNVEYCIGAMNRNGEQAAMVFFSDGTIGGARSSQLTTACMLRTNANGTNQYTASFKAMNSDGFSLNSSAGTAVGNEFFWVAFKGVDMKIGTIIQPVAGNQSASGVGFVPKETIFMSYGDVSSTSTNSIAKTTFGIGESSSSRSVVWAGES